MFSFLPYKMKFLVRRPFIGALSLACAGLAACAHSVVITSDPPGKPAYWNGELVGETPVRVEEREPFATHKITIGDGPQAVTEVVLANRVLAKDGASALLMPFSCLCFVPLIWTAGTDDRVHVAREISGRPIGGHLKSELELEYLAPGATYPNTVRVERQVVQDKEVRVMTDRRSFVTTVLLGLAYPSRRWVVHPETKTGTTVSLGRDGIVAPNLSFGAEQEWYPIPRLGIGGGFAYGRRLAEGNDLKFVDWRAGLLARYRQPLLHWDGVSGGLDGTLAAGGDLVFHNYSYTGKNGVGSRGVLPWVEAGFDFGFTRALSVFVSDRYFPTSLNEAGLYWGNLGATPEQHLLMGLRLFW